MFGLMELLTPRSWFARPPDWAAVRRWFAYNKTASLICAAIFVVAVGTWWAQARNDPETFLPLRGRETRRSRGDDQRDGDN